MSHSPICPHDSEGSLKEGTGNIDPSFSQLCLPHIEGLADECSARGFPCGSARKESACNVGDLGSIPGLGRSPGEEKGYPHQYSGLENSMDCIAHGVAKSQT